MQSKFLKDDIRFPCGFIQFFKSQNMDVLFLMFSHSQEGAIVQIPPLSVVIIYSQLALTNQPIIYFLLNLLLSVLYRLLLTSNQGPADKLLRS